MKRIISCSYKDDTPAFHAEEFFENYRRGFVMVPTKYGPMRVSLKPEDVYAFVFWTKNPSDYFVEHLSEIKSPWYIQWTITDYDNDIEMNLPAKREITDKFVELSKRFGKEHFTWRYDPILLSEKYSIQEHHARYRAMCEKLAPYTTGCVISFFDEYSKIQDNIRRGEMRALTDEEVDRLSAFIGRTAALAGVPVQTCAEGKYDLSRHGIIDGPCIDPNRIERLTGERLPDEIRRPGSFRRCACAVNTDIGQYHRCKHGCKYCYAK